MFRPLNGTREKGLWGNRNGARTPGPWGTMMGRRTCRIVLYDDDAVGHVVVRTRSGPIVSMPSFDDTVRTAKFPSHSRCPALWFTAHDLML